MNPKRNQTYAIPGQPAEFRGMLKRAVRIVLIFGLPFAVLLLSFTMGRYSVSLPQMADIIRAHLLGLPDPGPASTSIVLLHVRLPRIAAALLVGGALAAAGASYQGLFRNPMVSPDILGASAGAGFGAALAMLMSYGPAGIQLMSFLMGMGAVALTTFIGSIVSRRGGAVLSLVLTGIVISTVFTALTSITKLAADPDNKLPAITFWLMGGLSLTGPNDLIILAPLVLIGLTPLLLLRWKLNVLSFGEEEAQALGVNTTRIRFITIISSTLLTAAAVSVSGIIGWVGLIVPHLSRMVVGPNYKVLLPVSALYGAAYLLLVDDIARSALTLEIPLGILTALIGAPFFILLLITGKRSWE
ncbi:FecCD family ABC transporter permease [Paenibacillus sabinae]|uniref:ABC transporter permease n=1 Tax=Paenibacillus sabinae T27 TaxID=1268072 RepID=X4ZWJ8_9BACL|nr:iron ABC transporter permease [Paenibacillus sabinae]AHV96094.1 ABC transporter permease [Paenibacillus sabinae T27]